MVKNETIQIGLRIEKELLRSLEFFAKTNKVDKMALIRQAIAGYVDDMEAAFEDAAVEDFIRLRINEDELKEHLHLKEISTDVKEARKKYIEGLTKGGEK